MRLALAQINPVVGDIAGNVKAVKKQLVAAREGGAQLVLFPELCVTGYPPEDLLLKEHFLRDARAALNEIAAQAHGIVAVGRHAPPLSIAFFTPSVSARVAAEHAARAVRRAGRP